MVFKLLDTRRLVWNCWALDCRLELFGSRWINLRITRLENRLELFGSRWINRRITRLENRLELLVSRDLPRAFAIVESSEESSCDPLDFDNRYAASLEQGSFKPHHHGKFLANADERNYKLKCTPLN